MICGLVLIHINKKQSSSACAKSSYITFNASDILFIHLKNASALFQVRGRNLNTKYFLSLFIFFFSQAVSTLVTINL